MQLQALLIGTLSALALAAPATIDPFSLPSDNSTGQAILIPHATNTTSNSTLEERGKKIVIWHRMRYCEHANGKGRCVNQDFNDLECYGFQLFWNNRISSAYVNPGSLCEIYDSYGCKGREGVGLLMPGLMDFKTKGFSDKASSVMCQYAVL